MTTSMKFTALTIAARLALAPQPQPVQPVEPNSEQSCAALDSMAQALTGAEERREKEGEGVNSNVPLAGEEIDAPGDAADGGEAEDSGLVSMADTSNEERRQMRDTQAMQEMIGSRIRAAREFGAVSQTDFATWIGHRKSTQPSLWEKGARLPPVHELPRIAKVLGVSIDYLMGLSDDPERDSRAVRRTQVVNQVRAAVEAMADVLADQLLHESGAVDGLVRSVGLVTKVERLVAAVGAVRAANADAFDELRAGATLVRAAAEAQEAATAVGVAMDEADVAIERAYNRLRASVREAAV